MWLFSPNMLHQCSGQFNGHPLPPSASPQYYNTGWRTAAVAVSVWGRPWSRMIRYCIYLQSNAINTVVKHPKRPSQYYYFSLIYSYTLWQYIIERRRTRSHVICKKLRPAWQFKTCRQQPAPMKRRWCQLTPAQLNCASPTQLKVSNSNRCVYICTWQVHLYSFNHLFIHLFFHWFTH